MFFRLARATVTAVAPVFRKRLHPRRDRDASNSRALPISRVPSRPGGQKSQLGADARCLSVVVTGQGLELSPQTDIPINVEVARNILFSTEDSANDGPSFDRKGASRQNLRDRMTEMTDKGLLRKSARGQWVVVKDAQ